MNGLPILTTACLLALLTGNQAFAQIPPSAVDSFCQPRIRVKLVELPIVPTPWAISLLARTVDDGLHYRSELILPELESYLIPRDRGVFEWRNLDGRVVLMKPGRPCKAFGALWRLSELADHTFEIDRAGGNEHYIYRAGLLAQCRAGFATIGFEYDKRRLVRLIQLGTNPRTLAEFRGRFQEGRFDMITNSTTVELLFAEGNVGSVRVNGNEVISAAYKNALLSDFRFLTRRIHYDWGAPRWKEYFRNSGGICPIVCDDGVNHYVASIEDNQFKVNVIRRGGDALASWAVNLPNAK